MEIFVKKLVAFFEEREEVESSQEEFNNFLEGIRPDFKDPAILGIKFVFSNFENFDEAEESSWFLSPYYIEQVCTEESSIDFDLEVSYGPKLAAEIPPEILSYSFKNRGALEAYEEFYLHCLKNNKLNLPIREKLKQFVEYVNTNQF